MTINIVDIAPQLRADIPGCPMAGLTREIRTAAREFSTRSKYWRVDLASIDSVLDEGDYALSAPSSESVIIDILAVKHNDILIERKYENEMDASSTTWRTDTSDQATGYLLLSETEIQLYPAPDAVVVGAVDVKVALKPSTSATTLPQTFNDQYLDAILSGAKARLMVMPGKQWSNPQLSQFYRGMFEAGINEARNYVAKLGSYKTKSTIIARAY